MFQHQLYEYLDRLTKASELDEIFQIGVSYATDLGFQGFLYGQKGGTQMGGSPLILSNYNKEWMGGYVSNNAIAYDPLVRCGVSQITPATWQFATSRYADKKGVMFMKDAGDFEMRSGVVLPARGLLNERAIISMHSEEKPKEMDKYFRSFQGDMALFTLHYHEAISRVLGKNHPVTKLTKRELEVIRSAADGKDTSCIAKLMGISEVTVLAHFTNAFKKLGAENRVHAVAIALQSGLIVL